ncbi:MAG TPA: bifunctional pyr operon transcriptional regulator/uracil phosphoribosyltransferase PyrR [Thermodesulfovibrionia bacterium]|nr:bifunctional pyr operon transcriptional regulator/uracil phosphoribosyltransferase PyrR [Thermodesulfovibrionia bacterium]
MPKEILNNKEIERAIKRISYEIIEKNKGAENFCLIGIQRGGVLPAKKLAKQLEAIEGCSVDSGTLDITFYRDDISLKKEQPVMYNTHMPFSINNRNVVLVDDVIFTGRTVRAAMDALLDFGRPAAIQLAVLIDRGHREFPIQPNYVGKVVPTSRDESVLVSLFEESEKDSVTIR